MAGSNNFISLILIALVAFTVYEVFITKDPMPFFAQFRGSKPEPINTNNTPVQNNTPINNSPVIIDNSTIVESDYPFEVHYIDIGQGDSELIKYPDDKYMLIDGGPRYEGTTLIHYLQSQGISEIDTVVATHPDSDHIGGLIKVFTYFKVNRYLYPNDSCDTLTCEELDKAVAKAVTDYNMTTIMTNTATNFYIDNSTRTIIFNPPIIPVMNNDNANSIVIKIIYGSNSFLFTGDCDFVCEQAMINTQRALDSDVLKVAHHGSAAANSQQFIDLVSPSISVISVGPNSYGLPTSEVLKRLSAVSRVLRTDELGTITIKSNGEKLVVE